MYVDNVIVPCAHGFKVVLLQAEQQRLGDLHEAVLIDEYLLCGEALMGRTVAVEHTEGSAAAVQYAPDIVLLKEISILAARALPALSLQIIEGVL